MPGRGLTMSARSASPVAATVFFTSAFAALMLVKHALKAFFKLLSGTMFNISLSKPILSFKFSFRVSVDFSNSATAVGTAGIHLLYPLSTI